jgi:hypothetical protein
MDDHQVERLAANSMTPSPSARKNEESRHFTSSNLRQLLADRVWTEGSSVVSGRVKGVTGMAHHFEQDEFIESTA